jgi:hypothetical protein
VGDGGGGTKFDFPLTIMYPGDQSSNMELNLSAVFEHAKIGMLVFTVFEGRQLKSTSKLDNFVSVNMGEKYMKRTKSIKDGKGNPWFKEEKLVMWVSAANWVDDCVLRAWDDDGANNDVIGETTFSVLPYMAMTPDKFTPQVFAIMKEAGAEQEQTGEVVMKVSRTLPSPGRHERI